jgi:hypothetical protein
MLRAPFPHWIDVLSNLQLDRSLATLASAESRKIRVGQIRINSYTTDRLVCATASNMLIMLVLQFIREGGSL